MRIEGARTALALCLVLGASNARAQAPSPSDPGDAAYAEGRRYYDLRDWDLAIERFKEAYRLRSDAASLFNIAQSYRLEGDCTNAVAFYKTYKRNFPEAANLALVDEHLSKLEPCAPPPPTRPTPAPASAPIIQRDAGSGRGLRLAGLVTGGIGAIALGTGAYFGLVSRTSASDVESGSAITNGVFDPDVERRGERAELVAKILLIGGGATLAGGVVMYLLGRDSESTVVNVVPASGGGAVLVWRHAL
jgi:tetratricopeptide (TPR) repeat protein